eukprot:c42875_g1_i1 orf=3-155(-)
MQAHPNMGWISCELIWWTVHMHVSSLRNEQRVTSTPSQSLLSFGYSIQHHE